MAFENDGAQGVPEIEDAPSTSNSCSTSTNSTGRDTPKELPIIVLQGKRWKFTRTQRSKSVPNPSHMENRRTTSTNRTNQRSLRMFNRSFSVQWRSLSRYTKMSSPEAAEDAHRVSQRPVVTTTNEENLSNQGHFLKQTMDTPPPHYSSLDSSLDIVPGGRASHMNYGFRSNESVCIMNNDPPPSYRELFSNRMRHTVRQMSIHSTTSEYPQQCTRKRIAKYCAIGIFFLGFAIVLPVAMVIQGITHLDDCPIEPRIPIFLIVGGLLQLLECFGRLICKHCTADQSSSENREKMSWDPLLYILFILLILSSVYIYQTHPSFEIAEGVATRQLQATMEPTTSSESPRNFYCHKTTFRLAYWIVTSYYAVIVVTIVGTVSYLLCSSYMTYREQRRMGQQQERQREEQFIHEKQLKRMGQAERDRA